MQWVVGIGMDHGSSGRREVGGRQGGRRGDPVVDVDEGSRRARSEFMRDSHFRPKQRTENRRNQKLEPMLCTTVDDTVDGGRNGTVELWNCVTMELWLVGLAD